MSHIDKTLPSAQERAHTAYIEGLMRKKVLTTAEQGALMKEVMECLRTECSPSVTRL